VINSLFEIVSKIPVLVDSLERYRTLEELDEEALAYVRSKWGEAERKDIQALSADVLRVKWDERTCADCRGSGNCPLHYHPLILSANKYRGRTVYNIYAGNCGSESHGEAMARNLIKVSGLTPKQMAQTFDAYVIEEFSEMDEFGETDMSVAKDRAMCAAKDGSWIVLAGKRGTGKSHLAVAIMLDVMSRGVAAMFCPVVEMLDELRQGNEDNTYPAKMKRLKDIPCLVLDDLGKERTTATGLEYLFQILDFRYRHELQTIITTSAKDPNELIQWTDPKYFVSIISRLNEMGAWCTINEAKDYRGTLLPMGAT
jgi:DNA replication protein DnaC